MPAARPIKKRNLERELEKLAAQAPPPDQREAPPSDQRETLPSSSRDSSPRDGRGGAVKQRTPRTFPVTRFMSAAGRGEPIASVRQQLIFSDTDDVSPWQMFNGCLLALEIAGLGSPMMSFAAETDLKPIIIIIIIDSNFETMLKILICV